MMKKLERILLGILLLGVLMAPQTSQVNTYTNGQVLTADQLNAEFGNLYSTINGLDEENFLDTTSFPATYLNAAAAGAGLARDNPTGVLSVGVDDVGIEISSDALRLKALGVTTAKLGNDSVTSAKIVDATITGGDISTSAVLTVGDGAVGAPAYSFGSDTDNGMYRIGANNVGVAAGGSKILDITTSGLAVTGAISGGALAVTTISGDSIETSSGGAVKMKVFSGSLAASGTTNLTISGTVVGAYGWSTYNGTSVWTTMPDGIEIAGDTSHTVQFEGYNGTDGVGIANRDSNSTNSYKVVVTYQ